MESTELDFTNREQKSLGIGQVWTESEDASCTRTLSDRVLQRTVENELIPLSRPRATSCDHLCRSEVMADLPRKGFTSLQCDLHAVSWDRNPTAFNNNPAIPQAENITNSTGENSIDIQCEKLTELSDEYSAEQTQTSGSNIESGYNTDRDNSLPELAGHCVTMSDSTLQILMVNWFRQHNPEGHSK